MTCQHGNDAAVCNRCAFLTPLMCGLYGITLISCMIGIQQMPAHVAQDAAQKRQSVYMQKCLKEYRP